jgi:transposase-like protein
MAQRTKPRNPLFGGRWFEDEIIILCLRWYFRYKLSYRDLGEMMAERGLLIAHTTILRWAIQYAEAFQKRWRR